jgi:hypothetical protein
MQSQKDVLILSDERVYFTLESITLARMLIYPGSGPPKDFSPIPIPPGRTGAVALGMGFGDAVLIQERRHHLESLQDMGKLMEQFPHLFGGIGSSKAEP